MAILFRVLTLFLLFQLGPLHGEQIVTLAADERPPYVGRALPGGGYVAELVQEAFKRKGYKVKIDFYPSERAKVLGSMGRVDGVVPVDEVYRNLPTDAFMYSSPFPGGNIGLLKKRSLAVSYSAEAAKTPDALFKSLARYRFGAVRGGATLPSFDDARFLAKEMVGDEVLNLDKLDADRVQFSLIDKYTAADLMVGQRPHLIGQLEFMAPPLAQRDFYIAFSSRAKEPQTLVRAFNEGLAEVTLDGTLERILNRHGLFLAKKIRADHVRLVIGTVNNSDMIIMRRLSKEFERQNPKIELEWRILDESTLRLRLLSDLAISDGQFDIMTIGTYEIPIWAKRGWLAPLQGLPEKYEIDDLVPTVRAALTYEGNLFAAPFYVESSMTFYRKDLFANAGLTMPTQPKYSDIMRFAARIHNPAAGVYGICLRGKPGWGGNVAFVSTLVNAFGGRWFDEQWHPELDSAAWHKAVSFYVDVLKKYGPPNPERNGFNENLALFARGHCGMWIDATVAAGILFDPKRSLVSGQVGYVTAPTAITRKGNAWLWSWALAIPYSSLHKKEATQFIAWATSKGYIQTVANQYGWVAVPPGTRKSTYANPSYVQAAPFAQFVLQAIENADIRDSTLKPKPYPGIQYVGTPEFPAVGDQVGLEIARILRGEQSVAEALAKSQAFAHQRMKNSTFEGR